MQIYLKNCIRSNIASLDIANLTKYSTYTWSHPILLSNRIDFYSFLACLSRLIWLCQSGYALIDIFSRECGAENTFCHVRGELLAGKISITPFREGDGSMNRADWRGRQIWLRSIRRIESRDCMRQSRIRGHVRTLGRGPWIHGIRKDCNNNGWIMAVWPRERIYGSVRR